MGKIKKTRNLFILKGKKRLVLPVLEEICFKGVTVFNDYTIPYRTVTEVFRNNKSVVCRNVSDSQLKVSAINITVIESDSDSSLQNNIINVKKGNIAEQFSAIANFYNCDIGDHKSNTSASTEPFKRSTCPYCRYIDDGFMDKDINLHRTLYSSKNFFVIPTIGEFVKGYLLIIPFDHVMSNAELSLEKRYEFLDVLNDVAYMLKLTYGTSNILVWENGSGNGGASKSKTSIVHSHTHVAPSRLDAGTIEKLSGFPFEKISYEELYLHEKYSYLLLRGKDNNDWRINDNPNLYIPRQYVRQLLLYKDYTYLPNVTWDWRAYPFIERIKETCSDIQKALEEHWDKLPDRIKNNTKDIFISK